MTRSDAASAITDAVAAENAYAAFLFCCKRNDKTACACLASLSGRDVQLRSARDKSGNTLLHAAVSRGCCQAAEMLIRAGLSAGVLNNNAKSAMALAEDFRVYGSGYRKTFEFLQRQPALPRSPAKASPTSGAAPKLEEPPQDSPAAPPSSLDQRRMAMAAIVPASPLVGQSVARLAAGGDWEEGLVLCDDGSKGLVVKFEGRAAEHHPESVVRASWYRAIATRASIS